MFSAELDPASWRQYQITLQKLADATDRPVDQVLRQQGRLLAKDLAHHIHPRGLSAGIGKEFKSSITRKIQSLYRPVGWLHDYVAEKGGAPNAAKALVKFIRRGHYTEARRFLEKLAIPLPPGVGPYISIGPFDGGRLHKEWRWRRRRRYPIHVVPNFSEVNRYARSKEAEAGLAKGALVQAGKQLDGKSPGIPAWISRHSSARLGTGVLRKIGKNFSGFLQSNVRYSRQALPLADEIRALDVRQSTAEKQLKRIVDANVQKAMRRFR